MITQHSAASNFNAGKDTLPSDIILSESALIMELLQYENRATAYLRAKIIFCQARAERTQKVGEIDNPHDLCRSQAAGAFRNDE